MLGYFITLMSRDNCAFIKRRFSKTERPFYSVMVNGYSIFSAKQRRSAERYYRNYIGTFCQREGQ